MYRSCLTLLFVFLFTHFAANAQSGPSSPRIALTRVSVDAAKNIELTWEYFNMDWKNLGSDSLIIYRCTTNCGMQGELMWNEHIRLELHPDSIKWKDSNANGDSLYYYCVIGHSPPGLTDFANRSAPQNNIVLTADKIEAKCSNAISLSWNSWVKFNNDELFKWDEPHANKRDTLDYNILYRKLGSGNFELAYHIEGVPDAIIYPATEIPHEVRNLDLDTNYYYEFRIQAISRSGNRDTVFSNIVVSKIKNPYIPAKISIARVSVIDSLVGNPYIEIDVKIDNPLDHSPFDTLYLLRTDSLHLPYTRIRSVSYNAKKGNIYTLKDTTANPTKTYYYNALPHAKCYTGYKPSYYWLSNIVLWGGRQETSGFDYEDCMRFGRYNYPEGDTLYDWFRFKYRQPSFIQTVGYGETLCLQDTAVSNYMENGRVTRYQIVSKAGFASNILTIRHESIVSFPNAFNPGDLNFENTTFHPIFVFPPDKENYLFIIYNRWGQELFRTEQPPDCAYYKDCRWDGTFQGKECPPGIYAYKISYTFNQGRSGRIPETGSFMLVR